MRYHHFSIERDTIHAVLNEIPSLQYCTRYPFATIQVRSYSVRVWHGKFNFLHGHSTKLRRHFNSVGTPYQPSAVFCYTCKAIPDGRPHRPCLPYRASMSAKSCRIGDWNGKGVFLNTQPTHLAAIYQARFIPALLSSAWNMAYASNIPVST
jgi:hypothetical protein